MKVPLSWLREHLNWNQDSDTLVSGLTGLGLEVEQVHSMPALDKRLCVVRIETIEPHPNSETLQLVTVLDGQQKVTVVCGAPHVFVGQLTLYAPPQTKLAGITVTERKVRGVMSPGMLCSEKDCGIGMDHSGLVTLDETMKPGTRLTEILPTEDTILELGITPNRGDCLSIRGIARELAALTQEPLLPVADLPDIHEANDLTIHIANPENCPGYAGAFIQGVTIQPSNLALRYRLFQVGLRAINNIVDVTNYILWDLGQPMHAFDRDTLQNNKIDIRQAQAGESILALDDKTYQLTNDDLVIADGARAIAVAGVIGGRETAVTEKSTRLFLESAFFKPRSVRQTARRHNLRTDSSYRFERGCDPGMIPASLKKAASMILSMGGGQILHNCFNIDHLPLESKIVPFRSKRCSQILGLKLSKDQSHECLKRLNIYPASGSDTLFQVPTYRHDLDREIDLIEEVARIEGYNKIPENREEVPISLDSDAKSFSCREALRKAAIQMGGHECINYSFVGESELFDLEPFTPRPEKPFALLNPLSPEQKIMRNSLIPGLIKNWNHNRHYQQKNISLFEVGKVFAGQETILGSLSQESDHLAWIMGGNVKPSFPGDVSRTYDLFDCKGFCEQLLEIFGLSPSFVPCSSQLLSPCLGITIGDTCVGLLGQLSPAAQKLFACKEQAFCGELKIELVAGLMDSKFHVQAVNRFPAMVEDLSFFVKDTVSHQEIETAMRRAGISVLKEITAFDVYRGKHVPIGKKSVAYSLTYRDKEKTLTHDAISRFHEKIKEELTNRVSAEFR